MASIFFSTNVKRSEPASSAAPNVLQTLSASPSASPTFSGPSITGPTFEATTSPGPTTQIPVDTNAPLTSQYPPVPFVPKSGCSNHWTYIGCSDPTGRVEPDLYLMPTANATLSNKDCTSKTHVLYQNWMAIDTDCYPSNFQIMVGAGSDMTTQLKLSGTTIPGNTMATTSCYSGFESILDTFLDDGKTTQALCCLSNFTRIVSYRSILTGTTRYPGLNSSSINRCISWIPSTELLHVTVRMKTGDSIVLATIPLQTTSMMKKMKPYTIVYDKTMVEGGRRWLSSGQNVGIAIGAGLAGLAVLLGLALLWLSRTRKAKEKPKEYVKSEIESGREHEGSLEEARQAEFRSETLSPRLLEADVASRCRYELHPEPRSLPSELDTVHQISAELPADAYGRPRSSKTTVG